MNKLPLHWQLSDYTVDKKQKEYVCSGYRLYVDFQKNACWLYNAANELIQTLVGAEARSFYDRLIKVNYV